MSDCSWGFESFTYKMKLLVSGLSNINLFLGAIFNSRSLLADVRGYLFVKDWGKHGFIKTALDSYELIHKLK